MFRRLPQLPNRLGYLTSLNITPRYDRIDVTSMDSTISEYIQLDRNLDIQLELSVPNHSPIMQVLHQLFQEGSIHMPTMVYEWMCLYCASPNTIKHTHCDRCGAPRNFILG